MPRLFRPAIPVEVECRVLLGQLGEMFIDKVIEDWRYKNRNKARNLTLLRARLMPALAELIGCEASDLRLDHDPPLAARERYGEGRKTVYRPAANDPEHLRYRPQGPQHSDSHYVKTYVRGDHGQFSDTALIKRERRRQKKAEGRPKKKWLTKVKLSTKWPKRKFPSRRKP